MAASAAVDDLRLSLARHRRRAFRQDALALTLNEYGAQWLDVTSRQNSAMSRGCLHAARQQVVRVRVRSPTPSSRKHIGYHRRNNQNTRSIYSLGNATDKKFNTYSASSPTTRPKRESFLQMSFQERGYPYLGCVSQATQNRSPVYVLCWRVILGLLLPILGLSTHISSLLETVLATLPRSSYHLSFKSVVVN